MVWIESHSELRDHPKLRRLSRALGIDRRSATGLLHWLWWWAMDYAPDGDLSEYSDADIADGLDWDGDPAALMAALRDSGFLDGSKLHDWSDYGERLFRRRRANAERMKQRRDAHVQDTCSARTDHVGGLQDRTGQDRTKPLGARVAREATDELLAHCLTELPASQSTPEEYARTIDRYRGKLSDRHIEQVIDGLGGWDAAKLAKRAKGKLHLTLARWLSQEPPDAALQPRNTFPAEAPPEPTPEEREESLRIIRETRTQLAHMGRAEA